MIDDDTKQREYGVVAQEIQKIFPEMVSVVDKENGYLGVSYIQLVPVLIAAIKEQQVIIENLRKENAEQKSEISSLKTEFDTRLNKIEAILNTTQQ